MPYSNQNFGGSLGRKRVIRSSEAHKAHNSGPNGFFEVKKFKLMYGYFTSKKLDVRLVQGPSAVASSCFYVFFPKKMILRFTFFQISGEISPENHLKSRILRLKAFFSNFGRSAFISLFWHFIAWGEGGYCSTPTCDIWRHFYSVRVGSRIFRSRRFGHNDKAKISLFVVLQGQ